MNIVDEIRGFLSIIELKVLAIDYLYVFVAADIFDKPRHRELTYEVYDDDGIVAVLLVLPAVVIRIRQNEGGYVRRKYGGVHHEQQYDPVPDRLERRVVQYGPLVDSGGL